MFNAGVDVGKIQKIGRWKDMKTMLRYCHSYKSEEREAIESLSSFLQRRVNVLEMPTARERQ
jgi:hypothetical protein